MTTLERALSLATARARAQAVLESAHPCVGADAFTVVSALESVSAALLRSAGVDDATAREVLSVLWNQPPGIAGGFIPPRTPRRVEFGREYIRDLGQRLHVIRRVRRRSSSDIARELDLRTVELHDLEQGTAMPTALLLYRLAVLLQVPVPLLVDPKATPEYVLRLLRAGYP